jgi:hypothetical protein
MSCDDLVHSTTIEVIEPASPEVAAGAVVTLKVMAVCRRGCDLTGMPIKIIGASGAQSDFAFEPGPDDVAEVKLQAPRQTGEHSWTLAFGPHDVADIMHDEAIVTIRSRIVAHVTSLAVWSIPSPIVVGDSFGIKVGAKSSAGVALADERVEIRDETGLVVVQGCLRETPYPQTTALYWTTIELIAPLRDGLHTWWVDFEPKGTDLPHVRATTIFSISVVRPPEHRLTIRVVEKDTSAPIADAQVRLGAYRADTSPLGLAELDMPGGVYELDIWKVGHVAPTSKVSLDKNMLIEVEVVSVRDEDPDAAWLM